MAHATEIIAVGTELLLGNIANTNAQEISEALSDLGVNVYWHSVVGDNPERVKQAIEVARKRADIIITTGGLGPTYDDLTKQTICEAFGRKMELHEDILEEIVGDIWDESDDIVTEFIKTNDTTYEVSGDMNIDDFFAEIDFEPKEFTCEYSTMGGWAIEMLNADPHVGDSFTFCNMTEEEE